MSAPTPPSEAPRPPRPEARSSAPPKRAVFPDAPRTADLAGLPIRTIDMNGLVRELVSRAKDAVRTTACYANAHTVNLACRVSRYHRTLAGCDMLFADGISVVWAARCLGPGLPERMTAMDYFPRLSERCAAESVSMYLLGGMPGIAEKASDHLRARFSGLRIVGAHHGHFEDAASPAVIETINAAGPDILVAGLGSPRQEYWLTEHAAALAPPVRLCVGALFDYFAGVERRGPAWICDAGLEWLFRLCEDPAGKWRRYLLGNPLFVWNVLSWKLRRPHAHGPAMEEGRRCCNSRM